MAWVLKMDDATIESGLVHDFDASLSGIGQELGAGAYSMRLEKESASKSYLPTLPYTVVALKSEQHIPCLEELSLHPPLSVCMSVCVCYFLCTECDSFSLFWDLK